MAVDAAPVPTSAHDADAVKKRAKEEFPLWKLIIIAFPQFSVQILWCFIGPNSAPYMMHLGAGPTLATLNNIAGPITGFFTGPTVGAISDTLRSPMGRRRPVILFGLASLWVAGMLFASSEHLFNEKYAIFFAAPMYWVMDVTINILQTPHRALVADLAAESQQQMMQVVFVVFMSVGNFVAFIIPHFYPHPVDHMLELMFGICVLNTFTVGVQFLVAKETPLVGKDGNQNAKRVSPVKQVCEAAKSSPQLLWHLAVVQCLVWIGNTAWNLYSLQWFGNAVFQGDDKAPEGSEARQRYADGVTAWGDGGMAKSGLQLVSALIIIWVLMNTKVRPRYVYAPCIFIGVFSSVMAAFIVGHNGMLASLVFMISVMPETGSFAIPFGLVGKINSESAKQGKAVSTALQMALLNCCVTVGQQICTLTLAGMEHVMTMEAALPLVFMVAAIAQGIAGTFTLFLKDGDDDESSSDAEDSNEETSEESEC